MRLWERLTRSAETRNADASDFGRFFHHHGQTLSGQHVSAHTAENLATVTACVSVIASGLASLPALVYLEQADGRVEAPNHPVSRLIAAPNQHQTWPDWCEWTMAQVLLHGNAISVLEYDGAGRPISLRPIPWQHVSLQLLPSGRLAYDVVSIQGQFGGTGQMRRYLEGDVVHLRDRSDDGLVGRSRISRARDVLGNALALQDWSSHAWSNATTPAGAVKVPAAMSDTNFKRFSDRLRERHQGTHNARSVLILEGGAEWQPLGMSAEDAEVLDSRKFSVEELARLFNVPPPLVQDYTRNTFTNSGQADVWFASRTLAPWATKIEQEFKRTVFGPSSNYCLTIDLAGLMRGDFATRWQSYALAVQNNILDVNEIREQEGYGPRATPPAPTQVTEAAIP